MSDSPSLPLVLAGPLLRRVETTRLVFWLVATRPLVPELHLHCPGTEPLVLPLEGPRCRILPVGRHAFMHLMDIQLETLLPCDQRIGYDLLLDGEGIAGWAPHLLYDGATRPDFVVRSRLDQLLHGSCRKPHHPAADGLLCADRLLASPHEASERPALLMMSGDQVYADDVAGPMLRAIHRLIQRLGLFEECLEGAVVRDSVELYTHPASYYQRGELLPALKSNETLRERFFGGVRKPIFTSSSADNHLVTFAETLAMYLLVWSPVPWTLIAPDMPALSAAQQARYRQEQQCLEGFIDGLGGVARALAHLPTLMIFDDHDITDDWNLSAQWEKTAYGHPFSRRIIGNALLAYLLCQAWGNNPDAFGDLLEKCQALFASEGHLDGARQDALIDDLLRFQNWHYVLPTTPTLLVLDTRTRRWRSESNLARPSGLLDWEALCELQQALLDHPSAVIVSPAPIFGVKLIETVQKVFSWCGYPLLVDAENWMAHRGAAQVILNIFRHSRTPGHYVVLSGDVHYSFVYEVLIRHRQRSPHLWQVTSSGIKNQFPARLLEVFDRLNRWLYSPRSPLNWFTRRRLMEVVPRVPSRAESGERLWNSAGLGQVFFNDEGQPERVFQLNADGSEKTEFLRKD
ncbi:alkaline phosphatase D family protein [Pseudomonas sp. 148P]|uniref:Alkaline phosphatase D family protein n=1 Tax=Pseudomonas ulcerans TaxID=3115852 RepID=A0ABU7HQN7_9PSED|nr:MULTISPECIES: alkaline phosphatase D family protein [unclassified Pseudomonas]MEE1923767.1 alkaline phosphatase D family protein [Pseudomonas sp. 147P]MEE1933827.1 alkaline phosphatase D family protein [Pseudomonas sp. 148P]